MSGAGLLTAWNLKAIFKTTSLIIRLLLLNRVHLQGTFGSFPIDFMPLSTSIALGTFSITMSTQLKVHN